MDQIAVAQWNWNLGGLAPTVKTYPSGGNANTKTGIQPSDLANFAGVPLVLFQPGVSTTTPIPLSNAQLLGIIRQAEDWVETNTGILLTTTWVASPPVAANAINATGIKTTSPATSGMVLGVDYDLGDAGYDFFYRRYLMEGWGAQLCRYRPVQNIYYISFIYPLLSEFFRIPNSWIVLDKDLGYVRIVPAANVQMLPLFAMQLAFMGFAEELPGALYYQYTAGLTGTDYNTRFSFMKTLVLTQAAIYALNTIQGSVNFGLVRQATSVDGLRYDTSYPSSGAAYGGLIASFTTQRNQLLQTAIDLVAGPKFMNL